MICEVLLMHISEEILDKDGRIDPQKIDLVARMGADFYCRASGASVFEIAKPLTTIGIGVDSLPAGIRNSKILTGNNLGQLGNAEHLPSTDEIKSFSESFSSLRTILKNTENDPLKREEEIHILAKKLLDEGKVGDGWKVLMA